jgi:hypothetical protein
MTLLSMCKSQAHAWFKVKNGSAWRSAEAASGNVKYSDSLSCDEADDGTDEFTFRFK